MDELELSLIPSIVPGTFQTEMLTFCKTKLNPKTNEIYEDRTMEVMSKGDMVFTWVNNINPEENIAVPWAFVGHQTDASQGFGSGLTYAMRYFYLKYFNVATPDDDPDNWRSKQQAAEQEEQAAILNAVIDNLDQEIRAYIASHEDDQEKVREFANKYVKKGDYKKITNPELAAKMLKDFKITFLQEES